MIERLPFLFDGWKEARAWLERQPLSELPTKLTGTPLERHINSLLVDFS